MFFYESANRSVYVYILTFMNSLKSIKIFWYKLYTISQRDFQIGNNKVALSFPLSLNYLKLKSSER